MGIQTTLCIIIFIAHILVQNVSYAPRLANGRLVSATHGCGRLWLWYHGCGAGRPAKSTAVQSSTDTRARSRYQWRVGGDCGRAVTGLPSVPLSSIILRYPLDSCAVSGCLTNTIENKLPADNERKDTEHRDVIFTSCQVDPAAEPGR